jgi:hypothetical protein
MVQAFYNLLLYKKGHFNSMDRITTLVAKGQDQTDNAALLPYKLGKLEVYEGGNEGESMKKRHWR